MKNIQHVHRVGARSPSREIMPLLAVSLLFEMVHCQPSLVFQGKSSGLCDFSPPAPKNRGVVVKRLPQSSSARCSSLFEIVSVHGRQKNVNDSSLCRLFFGDNVPER